MASPKSPAAAKAKSTKPPSTHPSFYDMMLEGLTELAGPKGVTVQGLKSFIPEKYPTVDPAMIKTRLKKALTKGMEEGTVIRPKASEEAGTSLTGRFKLNKVKIAELEKAKKTKTTKAAKKVVKKAAVKKAKKPESGSSSKSPKKRVVVKKAAKKTPTKKSPEKKKSPKKATKAAPTKPKAPKPKKQPAKAAKTPSQKAAKAKTKKGAKK